MQREHRTARRWFRFSLRRLLLAVAFVAISLVVVPTAIHWWTWPEEAEYYRNSIVKVLALDAWTDLPEHHLTIVGGVGANFPTVDFGVGPELDAQGSIIPSTTTFRVVFFRHGSWTIYETHQFNDVDDALAIIRHEHWKAEMAWGPRLARKLHSRLEALGVEQSEDDDPFGEFDASDPFEF